MDFVIAVAWSKVLDDRYILALQSSTQHEARSVEVDQAVCARGVCSGACLPVLTLSR